VAGLVLAGCSESASESGAPAPDGQAAVTSDAVVAKPDKDPSEPGIVTTDAGGLEEPRVEATAPGSRVDADPRIVNAKTAWVRCMAGKGHAYRTIDAMYDDIDERRSPSPREGAGDGPDPETGGAEIDAGAGLDSNNGPALSLVLVEADAYESNVAVDNWDCGGTTQFLLYNEVFAEYSDRFIAENLDAILAGLADG